MNIIKLYLVRCCLLLDEEALGPNTHQHPATTAAFSGAADLLQPSKTYNRTNLCRLQYGFSHPE